MKMKFKSTTLNQKALLYKRFVSLEQSINTNTLYNAFDGTFWAFNSTTLTFIQVEAENVPTTSNIVSIPNSTTYLQYKTNYFWYEDEQWKMTTNLESEGITLLSANFNNIAKYQLNKYYYVGSFSYMLKGGIEGTTTQYIKGNIIPLTSISIKHFDDNIKLSPDDLVVIKGSLFSVENPEEVIKYQPREYKIYFATLNSIL